MPETNHDRNSIPKGGNVVHIDGSASWYRFTGITTTKQDGCMWAGSGWNYMAFPQNTVYLRCEGDGTLRTTDAIFVNGIWNASYFY